METGSGPLGLVGPVPEGAATVDMLVVTTRVAVPDETRLFNGERDTRMHQSRLVVSIPPDADRKVGEVAWPSSTPADPTRDFAVVHREIDLDAKGAKAWFHRTGDGRALIFVHGYNTEYDEAVFRFAQFVHDSGTTFTPILFTWASRGKVVEYVYDKESASYSRDAFETLLRAAAADPDVKEISILAHSMGTWLTMETLRQIAIRDGRLPAKIHDVILASPDIDGDVFRRQVSRLGQPRPRLTVFVSRDDKALGLSRLISGDVPRVGAVDPFVEPWKTTFATEKVRVFDLTDVKTADELAHGKFAADGDVARLIGSRLVAGQPIDSARDGLGESVGGAIGGTFGVARDVAGAAVGAPLSVLGQ
ncbi:MAG: alpha/beta hydrolase [Hyphomicrobiales bacterium]|nr:alpha/beta hydrolase [Hyphomicrobiales bacterium]